VVEGWATGEAGAGAGAAVVAGGGAGLAVVAGGGAGAWLVVGAGLEHAENTMTTINKIIRESASNHLILVIFTPLFSIFWLYL